MFAHSDRLPTGTPLPDGISTPAPWGLRRMAPYPALAPSYARVELDPVTQTGRYFDAAGQAMEMPGHGTSTGDVRVTVIGDRAFCVRIDSDLLDWRTDYARLRYRVFATCGLLTVPRALIEQTRPGGIVLVTLCGWLYSSELARLTVHQDGTASGRLLGGQTSFMLARPHLPPPLGLLPELDEGDERPAVLGADVLDDWTTRFVAQLAAPRAQHVTLTRDGRTEHLFLDVGTGARAVLWEHHGRWTVRQNGPSRLWDTVEAHIARWRDAGAPPLEEFEITLTSEQPSITWPSQ
ncbi:putative ATP-grasp-modified RiPP [Streptomyces prasinus]|uniref:putative ATP-grasp-modified RiPP n=1 Tax=Streptomyces prasinus TaxID=67345 RepID=UPI0034081163